MRRQNMLHRLQVLTPASNREVGETIDLAFWRDATNVAFCGVELHVVQGHVRLSLRQNLKNGGWREIATLQCSSADSISSPALNITALAEDGPVIRPYLESASDDAEFEVFLATNDLPETDQAGVAFLCPPLSKTETQEVVDSFSAFRDTFAQTEPPHRAHLVLTGKQSAKGPTIAPGVHYLPGSSRNWMRRAAHRITYGSLNLPSITHLAALNKTGANNPFTFDQALSIAPFLKQEAFVHTEQPQLPNCLFDIRQCLKSGLPRAKLDAFIARLEKHGAQRFSPNTPLPELKNPQTLRDIGNELISSVTFPRTPWSRMQMLLQMNQQRYARRQYSAKINQLEHKLKENQLWETEAVKSDLDRANHVMISLLKDRHIGQRAVIIGNGPSLKISDLERLKGAITFASNKIYLAYPETTWRPTYYSVEDHLVIKNNREAIAAVDGSLKIFPANVRESGFHSADTVFVPFLAAKSFEDPLSDPDFPEFSFNLNHGICWGSTITYSQIQLAVNMGCTEIILIGIDHSYVTPEKKLGNTYLASGEKNHFHKDYRPKNEAWFQPNLPVLEASYAKAKRICDSKGISILNASRRTELDVFDKANFDEIFPEEVPT